VFNRAAMREGEGRRVQSQTKTKEQVLWWPGWPGQGLPWGLRQVER